MLSAEFFDDHRHYRGDDRVRASDLDLAGFRISEKFDIPHSLPQFVECRLASPQQGLAKDSGNDALRASIEEAHAKGMLKIGNDFRNGRRCHVELGGSLRHAAVLHHSEEHEQITQPEPSTDLTFPLNDSRHKERTLHDLEK